MKSTRILTGLVAATLLFAQTSTAFAASTAATGSIGSTTTVEPVVYNVTLPANLDVAIDPFAIKTGGAVTGSQLSGAKFNLTNLTKAPVKVSLDFSVTTGTGVTLVDDPTTLSPDDDAVTDKKLYMAAIGAKTIDATTFANVAFDPDTADTLAPIKAPTAPATAGEGSIAFALDAGTGTVVSATGVKGVASFSYYGVMNTYAAWAPGDVTVAATYKLTALRPDTYTALSGAAVGVNQIKAGPTGPGFGAGVGTPAADGKSTTIPLSKASDLGTDMVIPFNFDGGTAVVRGPASTLVAGTDYTLQANSITIKASRLGKFSATAVGSTPIFTIVLSGTTTGSAADGNYVINWTINT